MLPIYALTPFTMLDFPDKTACIVWFCGCNMRCAYCHNPDIVRGGKGTKTDADVFDFLTRRRGLLDGVVLSGGEATLYDGIIDFARTVKDMGYAVKLDTNGTRPERVKALLDGRLLDYVALDYKAPEAKWSILTHCDHFTAFSDTLDMLCGQKSVPFEVRTTVHTDLLDETDIACIADDLKSRGYTGDYFVQNYIDTKLPSLGHLAPQRRELDMVRMQGIGSAKIILRNFHSAPARDVLESTNG